MKNLGNKKAAFLRKRLFYSGSEQIEQLRQ